MNRKKQFALALIVLACSVGPIDAAQVPFASLKPAASSVDHPTDIAIADFDRDGDLDYVSAADGTSSITWHENSGGKGTFVAHPIDSTGAPGETRVAAADIDGDGWVDVVGASNDSTGWYRNLGSGFDIRRSIMSFGSITSIATADIDRDGFVDVLLADPFSGFVAFQRNPASTTSAWNEEFLAGKESFYSVAAADVDGDGDPDVLGVNNVGFVWFQNAEGSFFRQEIVDDENGRAIVAADIDRDGRMDVVTASCGGDGVAWQEQSSDGKGIIFLTHIIDAGAPCPEAIVAADVDADGDLDVVTANSDFYQGGVIWYENLSNGFFSPLRRLPPGTTAGRAVAVGDIDGDGDLDILSTSDSTGAIGWSDNRTIHRNAAFPIPETISSSLFCSATTVADLDGNGTPDVVGGDGDNEQLEAYYSDASAQFVNFEGVSGSVHDVRAVAAEDLDGDGDRDLVVAHDSLTWFENIGLGTALSDTKRAPDGGYDVFDTQQFISAENDFRSVAVGDLNRDGWPDLVTGGGDESIGSDVVAWLNGVVSITWKATDPAVDCSGPVDDSSRPWSDPAFDDESWGPLVLPDLWFTESDDRFYRGTFTYSDSGRPHLLRFRSDDGVQIFVNGTEVFSYPLFFECQSEGCVNTPECANNSAVAAIDITKLLVPGTNVIAAHVTNGPGLGRFDARVAAYAETWQRKPVGDAGYIVHSVALGDLDGDGDPDVVAGGDVCGECGGFVNWYENQNELPFVLGESLSTASIVRAVAVGDVDRDGRQDIVAAFSHAIVWYRNLLDSGSGKFGVTFFDAPRTVTDETGARGLRLADLDQDGDLDVAAVSNGGSKVEFLEWFENDGTGEFGPQRLADSSSFFPTAIAIGDVDRDGDVDLVSGSDFDGTLTWNPNLGGQFTLDGAALAPPLATAGELTPLLGATVTLNARPGDSAGALASLELFFEAGAETPLTSAEANALMEALYVYRDNGSGAFEPGRDVLVATVDQLLADAEDAGGKDPSGLQIIRFTAGDPNVRIAAPATFFVVAQFAPGAGGAVPNQFRVWLHAPTGFNATSALDSSSAIVLTAEFTPDTLTGFVKALAPIDVTTVTDGFFPVDGLTGLREAVRQANLNSGEDRIKLGPGTFHLTVAGAGEDATLTGDLDFTDLTGKTVITGAGADVTIVDAGGLGDRVFHVLAGVRAEISGVTIRNGTAPVGGGIRNEGTLVLADSVVTGNTAAASGFGGVNETGGAIHNATAGADATLTISRATIEVNHAVVGGGIANAASDGWLAQVTVTDSTISGNLADSSGGGIFDAAYSGGMAVVDLVNVTLSDNTAGGSGGGAIAAGDPTGTEGLLVTLTNVTVHQNTTVGAGAGIRVAFPDVLVLRNSVVAGNASGSGVPDIDSGPGIVQLDGGNVIGSNAGLNASSTASDQIGTGTAPIDPKLGPLAPNGGPTFTHEPLPDSPVLDAGSCSAIGQDQRGQTRPVDLPSVANGPGGNACDSGAVELNLARTLPLIGVPLRWCALAGAPSIASPPPGSTPNDVLRERGRKVSEGVFVREVAMQFRSGASASVLDFPILDTAGLQYGASGNVFVDPERRNFDEFLLLINRCRDAWHELDPKVTGITAVHINRFVNADGQPIELLGLGGRANVGNAAQQVNAGRVMVVDDLYRENANPPDLVDALLGHELGHALSLEHGDGVDNDANDELDDDDDRFANKPRFDGPNLMQYRNGDELTVAQVGQMRAHALTTIPDITLTMDGRTETAPVGIDPGFSRVLDFGFSHVLDFGFANVLDFGFSRVLDFQFAQVLDFGFAGVLDFGFAEVLDFGFADVLDFGMVYDGDETTGSTTLLSSTGGLPWPSPIRPTTTYYYYMDLDQNVTTGGRPSVFGFPLAPGDPTGVELVTETTLSSTCGGIQCDDTTTLRIFKWNGSGYDLVPEGAAALQRISVGLSQNTGGLAQQPENLAVGISVQATIPNSVMTQAGWPLGAPVIMQALSVVQCPGFNLTLPNGVTTINCQCNSCESCPDYPGCNGTQGTPNSLPPSGFVLTDFTGPATLVFGKPVLPECSVQPETAGPGSAATVHITGFPSGQPGDLTATSGGAVLGTGDASQISGGQGSLPITLPPVAIDGALPITVGISGLAVEARCTVTISNAVCVGDCPTCDDHNPCTDDFGTFPACTNTNNTAACDDGNACTGPDACSGGACAGGPDICSAGVFMNEVHYDQTSSEKEFIELYATRGPVDLTGWTISDQDEMSYVIGRPANSSFPCTGTFSLNAGDLLLISQGAGTSVCTGTVRKIFLNRGTFLQRDGDDLVLRSANGICQDYVAFETGPSVNPLPPGCRWSGPNPTNGNSAGRSISRFDSPFTDTDRGVDWERSGTTTTIGPKTPGAPNMASPDVPDGLFLNEVHYDQTSAEREFIELVATRAVNLTGWSITDQDELTYVLGRPANPSFPCTGTFTLNAGDRLVIWQGSGTSVCTGPVREIYTKEGTVLQRDGDDVALFNGNGVCQDYVAFETGSKVNPAPKGCSWTGPNPNNSNLAGRSISRFDAPFTDTDSGNNWEASGATTTTGPKSPRLRNVP